ncbi:unnamed protein product, partial [Iphiclides podalirius]
MMMITFGVIAGLGLGLVYVTAVVSIAYWFEKKRNLAVGLGVSPEKVINDEAAAIKRHENILSYTRNNIQVSKSVENLPTYLTYDDKVSLKTLERIIHAGTQNNGEIKYPTFANKRDEKTKKTIEFKETYDPPAVAYTDHFLKRTHSEKYSYRKVKPSKRYQLKNADQNETLKLLNSEIKSTDKIVKQDSKENRREWFKKQLSVNHHYLKDLKMPLNSISHRNAMLNIKIYRLKASSCPDIFKNSMITINEKEEKWYNGCLSCFADMFNVSLFKKMTFNLMCLGTLILFVWFIVPYFYLAEHMIHRGYTEDDGAVMLSLIGITNTIGMVGLGWIGDFPKVSIGNLYAICLVLCGASVAAIPSAAANYWALALITSAFGLLFAASFTFTPSLLVKLVSLDDFTSAYGLVLLAQGIGHLIGPPLSGLIYDLTFSWELAFYLAGGWIIVSGVLMSFIQPVRNYQEKRENLENGDGSSFA